MIGNDNENDTGITFLVEDKWILKLCETGVEFNKEEFPQFTADDFAREFIDILEKQFNVSFSVIEPDASFKITGDASLKVDSDCSMKPVIDTKDCFKCDVCKGLDKTVISHRLPAVNSDEWDNIKICGHCLIIFRRLMGSI